MEIIISLLVTILAMGYVFQVGNHLVDIRLDAKYPSLDKKVPTKKAFIDGFIPYRFIYTTLKEGWDRLE